MTQYDTVNVKFSNSQLTKLKPAIKNGTGVTLNFSSNIIDDSNDGYNFLQKLLLTNTQFSSFLKLLQIILRLIKNYQKINYIK